MADAPRVLLLTCASLVGDYLARVFAGQGYELFAARQAAPGQPDDPLTVDLRDADSLRRAFAHSRPDVVLLCAALTNVDRCESEQELAFAVNARGPETVAGLCAEHRAKLVFFSSDYVFDGTRGPYAEDDPPSPVDYYGRTKLEAEQRIRARLADHLICRTTVVYGVEAAGKNFGLSLVRMLEAGRARRVPTDQIGNPTYALNLAQMVEALVAAKAQGIFNTVGPDLVSRCDFALAICRQFGLDERLVVPVTTGELQQPARRPLQAGLRTEKICALIPVKPVGIAEGLALFKKELSWKN